MQFNDALLHLRAGRRVSRIAWITILPNKRPYVILENPYPSGMSVNGNTANDLGVTNGTLLYFFPYFTLKTDQGQRGIEHWNPSPMDILSDDWEVIN